MGEWYNVLVDFGLSHDELPEGAATDVEGVFDNSIHVESIGENMWQVGLPVFASSHNKAYRQAADVVEAVGRSRFGIWPEVIEVNTYGPRAVGESSKVFR